MINIEKFLKMFPEPPDLWKAAGAGDVDKIKELVSKGADVNAKFDGGTPLHEAAYHKQAEAIKELVKLGGKINARTDEGSTPIHFAIKNGADTNLVELMIQLGADVNKGSSQPLSEAAALGDEAMVQCLLDHGAKPNGPAKNPGWPLLVAASKSTALVQILMKAGAKVNPDPGMDSPLAWAASFGKLDVVLILLAAGANPNHPDNLSATPLMSAVMCQVEDNKAEIVQTLLAAGADVNAKSMDEQTALDRAEFHKFPQIAALLVSAGAKRGSELPKVEQEQAGTSWELENNMVLGVDIKPWPPTEGKATLNVEVTQDDYNNSFSGILEYRVVRSENNSEPWIRVFGEPDEDGDFLSSEEIVLARGENFVQFRIKGKRDTDFAELESWPLKVQ